MIKLFCLVFSLIFLGALASDVSAHSGGTDKYGCHKDHKRGGYHCHNPKAIPDSISEGGVAIESILQDVDTISQSKSTSPLSQ